MASFLAPVIAMYFITAAIIYSIITPIAFIKYYKETSEEARENWQTLFFILAALTLIIAFFIFLFTDVPRYYIYLDVALFCGLLYACNKWLNKIEPSIKKKNSSQS